MIIKNSSSTKKRRRQLVRKITRKQSTVNQDYYNMRIDSIRTEPRQHGVVWRRKIRHSRPRKQSQQSSTTIRIQHSMTDGKKRTTTASFSMKKQWVRKEKTRRQRQQVKKMEILETQVPWVPRVPRRIVVSVPSVMME